MKSLIKIVIGYIGISYIAAGFIMMPKLKNVLPAVLFIIGGLMLLPFNKLKKKINFAGKKAVIIPIVILFVAGFILPECVPDKTKPTQPTQIEETTKTTENPATEVSTEADSNFKVNLYEIPGYMGSPAVKLNNNQPVFSKEELTTEAYEKYSPLDSLGRCGVATASLGKEIMPKEGEKRGNISKIKPSGWVQTEYDFISGKHLYNRCHLIGWQLSAENANKRNLITGTQYLNIKGMLPFENMVADYINETGNHVAYRATPVYDENDLLAAGVQIEAYSIEDEGDGICFNVFCYNLQEGVKIYYATGESKVIEKS